MVHPEPRGRRLWAGASRSQLSSASVNGQAAALRKQLWDAGHTILPPSSQDETPLPDAFHSSLHQTQPPTPLPGWARALCEDEELSAEQGQAREAGPLGQAVRGPRVGTVWPVTDTPQTPWPLDLCSRPDVGVQLGWAWQRNLLCDPQAIL